MSCCLPNAAMTQGEGGSPSSDELRLSSHDLGGGLLQTDLSVPGIHCAACIRAVEDNLKALKGVENARVNLSTKRVSIKWRGNSVPRFIETLRQAGYEAHLYENRKDDEDRTLTHLIRALAVAGFGAMNIMLLSVSIWSGADAATRQSFHWVSAFIALPVLAYSGQVFFRSAWTALKARRTNMDVPITIGVSLAFGLSFYDTLAGGKHAYFDASVTLLFFLLIGRTLDHMMREKARVAVRGLMRLAPRGATVLLSDGSQEYRPISEISPGMHLSIKPGDRVGLDSQVVEGRSDVDASIATGESMALPVERGSDLKAGMVNLTGALTVEVTARAEDSFIAEMLRLMEVAEGGAARYRRIADRAAAAYSPLVHSAALLTFLGWMLASGDWHNAVSVAISVLIITCPCALGLAVPIVQVVAARRLFDGGVLAKDGTALERLAGIDTVIFDKTGTLTLGRPSLSAPEAYRPEILGKAGAIAERSNHPLAKAIAAVAGPAQRFNYAPQNVTETPGLGMEATLQGHTYRLGRAEWALTACADATLFGRTVLSEDGRLIATFAFQDRLRPGAKEAVMRLQRDGLALGILSGDHEESVRAIAEALGISAYESGMLPKAKLAHIAALSEAGHKVAMIGDGLNDAPALVAAEVSMAPASAADIGRNAAGFVFLHDSLEAVPAALETARRARQLIRQNFLLAILYNALALPVAVAGYVTPLVAALAMSVSSLLVIMNALRLGASNTKARKKGEPQLVGSHHDLHAVRSSG